MGHVTVHSAGAPSTLPSSSLGLQDASPLKNMDGLAKLPRRHRLAARRTAHRPGSSAQLQSPGSPCEHLLRAPATNIWPGLAAATGLEITPSSSRGSKPRLRPIARESVRLRFELRRLLRICLAVCRKGERGNIQNGLVWSGWGSSAGPGGSSGSHPAWRAPVS